MLIFNSAHKTNQRHFVFAIFAIALLGSSIAGAALQQPLFALLPLGLLVIGVAIVDYRLLFWLFLGCIPVSIEFSLPNGLATDLPTEPLMWVLMLVFLLFAIRFSKSLDVAFLGHPISIVLLLHLVWMGLMILPAADQVIAFKFWIAKSWYVVTCYLMAGRLMRDEQGFKRGVWCLLLPLTLVILSILIKHAALGFSFSEVNKAMSPFYRNHVNYACIVVICLPLVWWAWRKQTIFHTNWWLLLGLMLLYLIAIQFSFTRAAYVAAVGAVGIWIAIRYKLMRYALPLAVCCIALYIFNYLNHNEYLNHAPNFAKTITHYKFDNLIEATAKGEDISTMERVHRWLAGYEMVKERPFFGFGPGNFYTQYRGYALTSFETYVSDNQDGSGIHCYYLMTIVEQGIFGGLLFAFLCLLSLWHAERIYHQTKDVNLQRKIMAVAMSLGIIYQILLINDMIETDKVGTFFFINLGLLVHFDLISKRQA